MLPKDSEFDSGLFTAACIVMTLGFPWIAFALAIWGVPGMWETTFLDGNHTPVGGAPSVNWGTVSYTHLTLPTILLV